MGNLAAAAQVAEAEAVVAVDKNALALATLRHGAPPSAIGPKTLVSPDYGPDYGTVPTRRKGPGAAHIRTGFGGRRAVAVLFTPPAP